MTGDEVVKSLFLGCCHVRYSECEGSQHHVQDGHRVLYEDCFMACIMVRLKDPCLLGLYQI